jgi:hypothetical protein
MELVAIRQHEMLIEADLKRQARQRHSNQIENPRWIGAVIRRFARGLVAAAPVRTGARSGFSVESDAKVTNSLATSKA